MSELMRQFLGAYIEWVESGAPESDGFMEGFVRNCGLCYNSEIYCHMQGVSLFRLNVELGNMFSAEGLNPNYPFNGSEDGYFHEGGRGESHLNSERLKWVRNKLGEWFK